MLFDAWNTTVRSKRLDEAARDADQASSRRNPFRPPPGMGAVITQEMPGILRHTSLLDGPARALQVPPEAIRRATAGVARRASPKAWVLTIRLFPAKFLR